MRFDVLGHVRVLRPDGEIISGGRLRTIILSVLLTNANRPVSVDALTDAAWGDEPDPRAAQKLQVHVHRWRRLLDDPDRLAFVDGAYCLRVAPGELDAERFESLVTEAGRLVATDPARTVSQCREALALWRATPFDGLDVPVLVAEAQRLADLRLAALELRHEAELACGRHAAVIPELVELVQQYPLRERLHGLLMTAFYRDGRRAEALRVYRDARATLVEELGVEPGPELRAIEQRILAGESVELSESAGPGRQVIPAQLPHDVTGFVGRDAELSELDSLLATGRRATLISAVSGTAGVGKTALAIHWAHRIRDTFPDGQLYVDLHGYGPDEPVSPHDALAGFLAALGANIPTDPAERAAHFRSLVDGQKVLVVLDNVRTVEQVRPLLPGSASCFVLVTSRDSLAGLVARDGAHRIDLDRLDLAESVDLLRELVGARLAAEPDAARTLAQRCARLPLVLRVAAEFIRARPARPLADLLDELSDEQRALDVLDADGDPHTAVRAVFSWSYRHLPEAAATMFRLLGVFPGHDAEAHALAALTGTELRAVRRNLDVLVRAHLAEETTTGRYRQHDLLRAYAAELSAGHDDPAVRDAAVDRLLDHYLDTAHKAITLVAPADRRLLPTVPPAPTSPSFATNEQARRWLDGERLNLQAAAMRVADRTARFPVLLATITWRYLDSAGHSIEARDLYRTALAAARRENDLIAQLYALRVLGVVYGRLGRYRESSQLFEEALDLFRRLEALGPQPREVLALLPAVLNNLGVVCYVQGTLDAAIRYLKQAAAEHVRQGNVATKRIPLGNLGNVYRLLGEYDQAEEPLWEALTITREQDDRMGESSILLHIAEVVHDRGNFREALDLAEQAHAVAIEIGNHVIASTAHDRLGNAYRQLGDLDAAARHHHEALRTSRASQNSVLITESLNSNGEISLATGDLDAAADFHTQAQTLSRGEQFFEEARALTGLGDVHAARGDAASARDHWQRALDIYDRAGVPLAEQVRAKLNPPA